MIRCISFLIFVCLGAAASAQESNILGLPAVPQTTASGAKIVPNTGPLIRDVEAKAILSGGVQMVSSYLDKQAMVKVTTINPFATEDQRRQAVEAARLVQRDLPLSCQSQCKPARTMASPKILPDGKLQFDMVIEGFPRLLDRDDMVNMIKGVPLAQKAAAPVKPASAPKSAASKPAAAKAADTQPKALTATSSATSVAQ